MRSVVLIVANLAVISALLWFFDVPYRQYRIDLLRDRLFKARDSLFAAACDGAISFSDPAYGMTRQIIDGMIRFADRVGLWQSLFMLMTRRIGSVPQDQAKFSRCFANARSSLSSNSRKVVDEALNCARGSLLEHIAHTSLCLFPFAVCFDATARVFGDSTTRKIVESLGRPALSWLDFQAYLVAKLQRHVGRISRARH